MKSLCRRIVEEIGKLYCNLEIYMGIVLHVDAEMLAKLGRQSYAKFDDDVTESE